MKISDAFEKEQFANQIVGNLLVIHSDPTQKGFGALTDSELSPSWDSYYEKELDRLYSELKSGRKTCRLCATISVPMW